MNSPRPERCMHCPPRTPPQRCWWFFDGSSWLLCASCFEAKTGRAPAEPPDYLKGAA